MNFMTLARNGLSGVGTIRGAFLVGILLASSSAVLFGARWDREGARQALQKAQQLQVAISETSQPTKSQYLGCIRTYRQVYMKDPHFSGSDDAIYSTGLLYEEMGTRFGEMGYYKSAIRMLKYLVSDYQSSPFCPDALLKLGDLYRGPLDDETSAEEAYQKLRTRYKRSKAALALADKPASPANQEKPTVVTPPPAPVQAVTALAEQHSGSASTIRDIRFWSTDDYTRVVIDMDLETRYHKTRLSNPDRIYFDISNARLGRDLKDKTFEVADEFLKRVRVAQNKTDVVRVVLDFETVNDFSVFELHDPFRVIIDIHGMRPSAQARGQHPSPASKARPDELALEGTKDKPATAMQPSIQPQARNVPKDVAGSQSSRPGNAAPAPRKDEGKSHLPLKDITAQAPTVLATSLPTAPKSADNGNLNKTAEALPDLTKPDDKLHISANDAAAQALLTNPVPVSAAPKTANNGNLKKSAEPTPATAKDEATKTDTSKNPSAQASATKPVPPPAAPKTANNGNLKKSAEPTPATAKDEGIQTAAERDSAASPIRGAPSVAQPRTKQMADSSIGKPPIAAPIVVPPPSPALIAAAPTSRGDRTLTRTLGLKIGRIVIDPGHGGHDTGTIGPGGLLEKDLVLEVAKSLRRLLEDKLNAEVVLTREDDAFVSLEERTALANQHRADLFVSIHANSSSLRSTSGVETYFLDFARTAAEREIAARENATSVRNVRDLEDLIKRIAQADKSAESRELAAIIQKKLFGSARQLFPAARNRGVRRAPFVVLIGANMPSVLAEVAFISNPRDEKMLKKDDSREKLASALFAGIEGYMKTLGSAVAQNQAHAD
jgi:N-acetylmuramoyl-L-alanine amidase